MDTRRPALLGSVRLGPYSVHVGGFVVIRTHPLPDRVRVSAEQPKSFCHNLQTEKLHAGDRVGGWSCWEQITRQKSRP